MTWYLSAVTAPRAASCSVYVGLKGNIVHLVIFTEHVCSHSVLLFGCRSAYWSGIVAQHIMAMV